VLPAAHRLTDATSFRRVLRRGRRRAARTIVVSVLLPDGSPAAARTSSVGLVVSKAVGGAVVRTRVKRRLRHVCAARLDLLPTGTEVVLRALPPAATASSADLGADLDRCLRSLVPTERVSA
jgi:ribonuclease P protein component